MTKDAEPLNQCSYVGETSRPWRERVAEHMRNLKNGSATSFIIGHWMEKHEGSLEAPKFKWRVLDSYKDALRRQLCEGPPVSCVVETRI